MKPYNDISKGSFRRIVLIFTVPLFLHLFYACQKADNDFGKADELQIRDIERAWAETAVTSDTSVINRILADDFVGTNPDGAQYSKQEFIDDMVAHPLGFTSNVINNVKVRFFNAAAVAQGDETFTMKNGKAARFVWTDVLVRRNNKWEIVAAEDLIAPVDQTKAPDSLFVIPPHEDLDGIDRCRREYVSAWLDEDAGHVAEIYTSDAVVMYPNQPAVSGTAAIKSYFADFFKEFTVENFELTSEEVQVNGSWAYDRGKYKWKGKSRSAGNIEDHGKYLVILERQADGSWKVARDVDNSDRPLSQAGRGIN